MADPTKTDKKTESIKALKDANKHLAELFADLQKKDTTLSTCSSDLMHLARQCGEMQVVVWVGNNRQNVMLKSYLETIAKSLEGARS